MKGFISKQILKNTLNKTKEELLQKEHELSILQEELNYVLNYKGNGAVALVKLNLSKTLMKRTHYHIIINNTFSLKITYKDYKRLIKFLNIKERNK